MRFPKYIGLEIEFQNTTPKQVYDVLKYNKTLTICRDASVETPAISYNGIPLVNNTGINLNNLRRDVLGGEVVLSNRISFEEFLSREFLSGLEKVLNVLHKEENSVRSSIHFHFDVVNSTEKITVQLLKNLIRMFTRMESLTYRLSSIFKDHRGVHNNYNYCRPITYKGPLLFRVSNENGGYYYGQVFTVSDLLESGNKIVFFERYGDCNNNGRWKYHPVRYHGFNLHSLFSHGTVEFRTMNFTSSLINVVAMGLYFYYTMGFILDAKYNDIVKIGVNPVNSLFSPNHRDNEILLNFILNLIPDEYKLYKNRLIDLFELGKYSPILDAYYVSHMVEKTDATLFNHTSYKPERINNQEIIGPTYTDIHSFERGR